VLVAVLIAVRRDLLLGRGRFHLGNIRFAGFCAETGMTLATAGTFVAAGAGLDASCAGGVAEADVESMYSQAKPGDAVNPSSVRVVAANSRFIIASFRGAWTQTICAH
jgi:hypothetical protein